MADFQSQAMGITGLTIDASSTTPSRAEFSTFLNDGVIDVTNRWLLVRPQDIDSFTREGAEQTSNGFNPGTSEIVSVIRGRGTDGEWYPCTKTPISLQYLVTDVESLHYASKYNPVYMITQNRNVHVFPAPSGAGNDGFKVLYINYSPEETDGSALDHASTGIKWFPDDKIYLVVLYASIKSIQSKMGATTITDLTITTVPPDSPSSPSFSAASVAATTAGSLGTAPTYTKPTITTRVSFEDFWEAEEDSNPFGDNDPGALTISVSAPTAPTLSTITYSSIDSAVDATLVAAATSTTLGGTTTPPAYTKPGFVTPAVQGGSTELTQVTAGTLGSAETDFDEWFHIAGQYIEDQEDTELAGTQLQKIQTYITAYQAELGKQLQVYQTDIQNELNEFNKENVAYQSSVQEALAEFQSANQIAIGNAERSQNRQLQNSAADMKVLFDTNTQLIQKYQSEIQSYQQSVADQVQEYNTKLQRYTTELTTAFQAWGKTETDSLQQYTADIQNELNEFNEVNVAYQSTVQEALQNLQVAAAKAQKDGDFTQQNQVQEYAAKIQKYQAELGVYQAEVANEVQEYTQNLQADGVGYQWLQDQYSRLKAEYDQAFMIAAPQEQAEGQ